MTYTPHTPESLVGRSDAPESTTPRCSGITSQGRQCRRTVASGDASPTPSPSKKTNASRLFQGIENASPTPHAVVYCWQHVDQEQHAAEQEARRERIQQSKTWTSIDSLADRLGVLEVNEVSNAKQGNEEKESGGRRGSTPPLRNELLENAPDTPTVTAARARKRPGFSHLFCFQGVEDENTRPPRRSTMTGNNKPNSERTSHVAPVPKTTQRQSMTQIKPPVNQQPSSASSPHLTKENVPPRTPERRRQSSSQSRQNLSPFHTPNRPSLQGTPNSSSSQTQSLLSLIPPTLSPQTTAAILSELAKPIFDSDTPGYIYIFLGASANSSLPTKCPSAETVTSALANTSKTPSRDRADSDIFRPDQAPESSPATNSSDGGKRTVILKIGRSNNVKRRANEWTRQCSTDFKIIRYYPYISSSSSSHPSFSPGTKNTHLRPGRKAPHIRRVERLIHLELSERRVDQGPCETCGKEHQELFEVEANMAELRVVDDCIRRWIDWAESRDQTQHSSP